MCLGVFWSSRVQTVLWVSRREWNWMLKWLNAKCQLSNEKLSEAVRSSPGQMLPVLIKTPIVGVPQTERSLKRSSFQEVRNICSFAQWHLCISQSMFMCLSSLQKLLCVSVRGLCWNCSLIQNIRLYFTAVLSQKQGRSWIDLTHPDWFTLSVGNGKPLLRILSWLICSMSGLLWQPFSIYSVRSTRSWAAAHVALIKKSIDNWPFHFPSLNNCDCMLQIGRAVFHTATAYRGSTQASKVDGMTQISTVRYQCQYWYQINTNEIGSILCVYPLSSVCRPLNCVK